MGALDNLLEGAIDPHVHTGPDLMARKLSDREAARDAGAAGMRGILLKSHVSETASRASIASELTGVECYGSLALNHFVGGINPAAVRAAIGLGARMIFMPTCHAANHLRHHPDTPLMASLMAGRPKGIDIFDDNGRLLPEVTSVLAAIGEGNATLATGHLAASETLALIPAAVTAGVRRIVVTHALSTLVSFSLDELSAVVRHPEVFVELAYVDVMGLIAPPMEAAQVMAAIELIGVQQAVVSSDGGQASNPLRPVEMMERFVALLVENGVSPSDVRQIVRDNPARALGLPLI